MLNILFVSPTNSSIYQIILKGFKEYTPDINVDFMSNVSPKYRYKNTGARVVNFLSKVFLNRNIKKIYHHKVMQKRFAILKDKYDLIFIIRPDFMTDIQLSELKSKTPKFIAYYWDTMAFFPRKKKIMPLFDKVYSFDSQDCRDYNLPLLTNFYYYEPAPAKIDKTLFCISHLEKRRYKLFNDMGKFLEENNISYRFMTKQSVEKLKSPYIEYMKETIPYNEMLKLLNHYEVILDIAKPNQAGLSFRIFESIGMNKKIITNNKAVMEYGFYNPNNILVIDFDNLKIPKSFFETPFQPIDESIKQKYHLRSFIWTIIGNLVNI